MPEVIEVRHYADDIKKYLKNEKILNIKITNGRYKKIGEFEGSNELLKSLPLKVIDIKTKGKLIYIKLENNFFIVSTLGLSGGWCFEDNNKKIKLPKTYKYYIKNGDEDMVNQYMKNSLNHLNVSFNIKNGKMWFYDVLSFGTLRYVNFEKMQKILKQLGNDIMDENTTFDIFSNNIKKYPEKTIGIVLMNQKVISGIGNYLRADVLYLSKISPFRKVKLLSNFEINKIFKYCKMLTWSFYDIKKSIKLGYYTKQDKLPEHYNRLFFVYGEEYDIFNNKITKEELYEGSQKRFIYWVKKIQK